MLMWLRGSELNGFKCVHGINWSLQGWKRSTLSNVHLPWRYPSLERSSNTGLGNTVFWSGVKSRAALQRRDHSLTALQDIVLPIGRMPRDSLTDQICTIRFHLT